MDSKGNINIDGPFKWDHSGIHELSPKRWISPHGVINEASLDEPHSGITITEVGEHSDVKVDIDIDPHIPEYMERDRSSGRYYLHSGEMTHDPSRGP